MSRYDPPSIEQSAGNLAADVDAIAATLRRIEDILDDYVDMALAIAIMDRPTHRALKDIVDRRANRPAP